MVKGLILTERDLGLLHDCYRSIVLSFSQVQRRHFPDTTKATAHNRLTKLKAAGLLAAHRVGILVHHGARKEVGVVLQVARQGLSALRSHFPGEEFRDEPLRLNTTSLAHDLTLTDALSALKKRFPGAAMVAGRLLIRERGREKRIPDAAILGPEGQPETAVELELTGKSDKRYREIILQYQLSPDFKKVLYIVAGKALHAKLRRHITQRREVPGLSVLPTGKFFFVHLDELMVAPETAKITNGAETLLISERGV